MAYVLAELYLPSTRPGGAAEAAARAARLGPPHIAVVLPMAARHGFDILGPPRPPRSDSHDGDGRRLRAVRRGISLARVSVVHAAGVLELGAGVGVDELTGLDPLEAVTLQQLRLRCLGRKVQKYGAHGTTIKAYKPTG